MTAGVSNARSLGPLDTSLLWQPNSRNAEELPR